MKIEILRGVTLDGGKTTVKGDKVEANDKQANYLIRKGKAKKVRTARKSKKND